MMGTAMEGAVALRLLLLWQSMPDLRSMTPGLLGGILGVNARATR